MTAQQAVELMKYVPVDKIRPVHAFKVAQITKRAMQGIKPDMQESKLLNEVYSYTNGGGDKQDQPFKAYRRKTSWGVK